MKDKLEVKKEHRLINTEFINKVETLENAMLNSDDARIAKGNSDMFPLKHSFSEGVYIREMFMQKGGLVIGKLYKISHTWFLLKGELEVATDEGLNYYIAPCYVHAPEGTKRVLHAMEDVIFVNVYPNPDNITDIEQLEDMLTCTSYEKYKEYKLLK
jgi:tetrahydromethanopterin S-methyltransferase subunit B